MIGSPVAGSGRSRFGAFASTKFANAPTRSAPFVYTALPYAMYESFWMSNGPMPVWMMPSVPA